MLESEKNTAKPLIIIDLKELDSRSVILSRELPNDWLETHFHGCDFPIEVESAHVKAKIRMVSDGILVQGTATARIKTQCNTCMNKVFLDLCSEISTYMLSSGDSYSSKNEEFTPEDLNYEYYEGDSITLDSLIGDSLLLEIPITPRCTDTCKKLDYLVTVNELEKNEKPVDHRLRALGNIKITKEN